jgi:hypothetical protein
MSLLELLFADDAAVCANSAEDLQIILQVFYDVFAEFGLEMALEVVPDQLFELRFVKNVAK